MSVNACESSDAIGYAKVVSELVDPRWRKTRGWFLEGGSWDMLYSLLIMIIDRVDDEEKRREEGEMMEEA